MTKWVEDEEGVRRRDDLPGRLRAAEDRRRPAPPPPPPVASELATCVSLGRRAPRAAGADRAAPPRLPVGPRADGEDDRPAHRRGGVRGRRRGARRRPEKLLDELGDLLFQVYFLALLLAEQGNGDLEEVARGGAREARPPAPARLRRGRGAHAGSRARALGADQDRRRRGARASSTTSPSRCRRCSTRARCSGARRRSATTGPTSPGRSRRSRRSCRAPGELARAGEPAPETEPDERVVDEVGDVLFTVVNLARRLNVDPELALRRTTGGSWRASSGPASSPPSAARTGRELGLEAQDRYYDEAKEDGDA